MPLPVDIGRLSTFWQPALQVQFVVTGETKTEVLVNGPSVKKKWVLFTKDRGAPEGIAAFLLILRYLASVALAIILFLNFFWHFMPYSQRSLPERQPNWWWFLAIMLAGGFLLTLGMTTASFACRARSTAITSGL